MYQMYRKMRGLNEILFNRTTYQKSRENLEWKRGSGSLPVHGKQKVFTALNQEIILLLQGFPTGPRATGMSQGKEAQAVI